MIVSNIYKNLCRSRLRHYGGSIAHLSNVLNGSFADHREWKQTRITEKIIVSQCKNYSSETQTKPSIRLPPLCDFPLALWPKFFNTVRNFFLFNMVIKARFDKEFNQNEFIAATTHALYVVSSALASENYERLEGLVTQEAIQTLRERISTLSNEQKQFLVVQEGDIYLTFPYNVDVFYEGETGRERTFVEIIVVHHYLQGLGRMMQTGDSSGIRAFPDYSDRVFVCNHRYRRELTEGVDSSWILNVVNHFSPNAQN